MREHKSLRLIAEPATTPIAWSVRTGARRRTRRRTPSASWSSQEKRSPDATKEGGVTVVWSGARRRDRDLSRVARRSEANQISRATDQALRPARPRAGSGCTASPCEGRVPESRWLRIVAEPCRPLPSCDHGDGVASGVPEFKRNVRCVAGQLDVRQSLDRLPSIGRLDHRLALPVDHPGRAARVELLVERVTALRSLSGRGPESPTPIPRDMSYRSPDSSTPPSPTRRNRRRRAPSARPSGPTTEPSTRSASPAASRIR